MASVLATALSTEHTFTEKLAPSINLIKGLGTEGDCHLGINVQHHSRLEILATNDLKPADIGENVITQGIDLLALGRGTKLHFLDPEVSEETGMMEDHAVVMVTGLRNPCPQIEKHRMGLQERFIERDSERKITVRKAGVMSTVEQGGTVKSGMKIVVEEPAEFEALGCLRL